MTAPGATLLSGAWAALSPPAGGVHPVGSLRCALRVPAIATVPPLPLEARIARQSLFPLRKPFFPDAHHCCERRYAAHLQPFRGPAELNAVHTGLQLHARCGVAPLPTPAVASPPSPVGNPHEAGRAVTIFVSSVNGSDTSPGTLSLPVKTIAAAVELCRRARREKPATHPRPLDKPETATAATRPDCVVSIRGGTYHLRETLELTSADAGLTITAYDDGREQVNITGSTLLAPQWRRATPAELASVYINTTTPVFIADLLSPPNDIPGLLVDGRRATLAKYPNGDEETTFSPEGLIPRAVSWLPPP